jgi:hypothetical protein
VFFEKKRTSLIYFYRFINTKAGKEGRVEYGNSGLFLREQVSV